MSDWMMYRVIPAFLMLLSLFVAAILIATAVDGVQMLRSQSAEHACREQGMDAYRYVFTTDVACVSVEGHAVDTIIVRMPQ